MSIIEIEIPNMLKSLEFVSKLSEFYQKDNISLEFLKRIENNKKMYPRTNLYKTEIKILERRTKIIHLYNKTKSLAMKKKYMNEGLTLLGKLTSMRMSKLKIPSLVILSKELELDEITIGTRKTEEEKKEFDEQMAFVTARYLYAGSQIFNYIRKKNPKE